MSEHPPMGYAEAVAALDLFSPSLSGHQYAIARTVLEGTLPTGIPTLQKSLRRWAEDLGVNAHRSSTRAIRALVHGYRILENHPPNLDDQTARHHSLRHWREWRWRDGMPLDDVARRLFGPAVHMDLDARSVALCEALAEVVQLGGADTPAQTPSDPRWLEWVVEMDQIINGTAYPAHVEELLVYLRTSEADRQRLAGADNPALLLRTQYGSFNSHRKRALQLGII